MMITNWEERNGKLYKKFLFKNFKEAFSFMTHVAMISEKLDHHPEWTNLWNEVSISLSTHDENNSVTSKDRELAFEIDQVVNSKF